ncbi:uncharacterized protein VTP21DRAFT_9036 [Calcarisporiella thermophila]|uniref:uncharacterized protein n=1 Tax=Calcarisporiella thermophila TaxID=911321 RepID=UPI00374315FD
MSDTSDQIKDVFRILFTETVEHCTVLEGGRASIFSRKSSGRETKNSNSGAPGKSHQQNNTIPDSTSGESNDKPPMEDSPNPRNSSPNVTHPFIIWDIDLNSNSSEIQPKKTNWSPPILRYQFANDIFEGPIVAIEQNITIVGKGRIYSVNTTDLNQWEIMDIPGDVDIVGAVVANGTIYTLNKNGQIAPINSSSPPPLEVGEIRGGALTTSDASNIGAIVGGVLGGIAVIALVIVGLLIYQKKRRTEQVQLKKWVIESELMEQRAPPAIGLQELNKEDIRSIGSYGRNTLSREVSGLDSSIFLSERQIKSTPELVSRYLLVSRGGDPGATPEIAKGMLVMKRYRVMDEPHHIPVTQVAIDEVTGLEVNLNFISSAEEFEREVAYLNYLRSPHIVEFRDAHILGNGHFLFVTESTSQNLRSFLDTVGEMDQLLRGLISRAVIQAIYWLHMKQVVHLNLSPSTFLSEPNDETSWRLSNFSTAFFFNEEGYILPNPYSAPEILFSKKKKKMRATPAMDAWSVGCLLYELWSGKMLFRSIEEAIGDMSKERWFPPGLEVVENEHIVEKIKNLLVLDPIQRLSIEDALETS